MSMRVSLVALAIAIVLALPVGASAAPIVIDADTFAVGTSITSAFAGVLRSSVGAGFDGDFDRAIYSIGPLTWDELCLGSDGAPTASDSGGYVDSRAAGQRRPL